MSMDEDGRENPPPLTQLGKDVLPSSGWGAWDPATEGDSKPHIP